MLDPRTIAVLERQYPQIAADPDLLHECATFGSLIRLPKGHNICHEGDRCSHLALLTLGSARVFKLAESGREITLYRIEPGECCILTASCMLSGRDFPANASAESEVEAVVLPETQVHRWMNSSESWRRFLWNLLAVRLGEVIGLVEEVAFRRIDQRLGEYLTNLAGEKGGVVQATHSQIAADLGTSREVVSRVLKDFEMRGLLRLARGRIELEDPRTLRTGLGSL